jgi:O-antigen/teichoic acid export membrane protein
LFLIASLSTQLFALLRYTLLARLLGPEQLGIAVALILTAQFFESVTDSSGDRFLIQDRQGDLPEVQSLVHLVWIARGLLVAAALLLLSWPLARFFEEPALRTGYLILAFSPLIAGFAHLDYRRVQRRSDFRGEARALLASEFASLVVTGIAAAITRDFTAILYGLITRSAVLVLVSRMVAERPYRAAFAPEHHRRLASFGAPIMLTGLVLFLGSQGDRLLIGKQLGLEQLGYYSAALLLVYYPTGALQKFMTTLHLPLIAGAADGEQKRRATARLGGQTLLLSLVLLAGYALVAPFALPLLYGLDFQQPALLIAAIGVLQLSRFIRLWPVTAALAVGQTRVALISNLARLSAYPLALLALDLIGGLFGILLAFAAAEWLSMIVTSLLVSHQLGDRRRTGSGRFMIFLAFSGLTLACARAVQYREWLWVGLIAPLALLILFVLFRAEHETVRALWAKLRSRFGRKQGNETEESRP